ncbi:MAG: hypothetical protein NVSMB6_15980 [Burkholderiaceae bacterium]
MIEELGEGQKIFARMTRDMFSVAVGVNGQSPCGLLIRSMTIHKKGRGCCAVSLRSKQTEPEGAAYGAAS